MPHPVHPLSQRVHHLKLPKDVPCNPTALPCRPGLGVKRFLYGQGEAHTQGQDHGDVRGHGCLFSGNLAFSVPPDLVKSRQAKISKQEHAIYATYPRPLPECPPRGVNPRQPPISIYCYYYLPILTYIVISL